MPRRNKRGRKVRRPGNMPGQVQLDTIQRDLEETRTAAERRFAKRVQIRNAGRSVTG